MKVFLSFTNSMIQNNGHNITVLTLIYLYIYYYLVSSSLIHIENGSVTVFEIIYLFFIWQLIKKNTTQSYHHIMNLKQRKKVFLRIKS